MELVTAPSITEFRKHLDNGFSHSVILRAVLGPGAGLVDLLHSEDSVIL